MVYPGKIVEIAIGAHHLSKSDCISYPKVVNQISVSLVICV